MHVIKTFPHFRLSRADRNASPDRSFTAQAQARVKLQKLRLNPTRQVRAKIFSSKCAECAVQTFKSMMKKAGEGNLNTKVSRVLFSYRITPQSTTGLSPAGMLQDKRLRSTLDQIHPDRRTRVERKQSIQKKHDKQVSEEFPGGRRSDHKKTSVMDLSGFLAP